LHKKAGLGSRSQSLCWHNPATPTTKQAGLTEAFLCWLPLQRKASVMVLKLNVALAGALAALALPPMVVSSPDTLFPFNLPASSRVAGGKQSFSSPTAFERHCYNFVYSALRVPTNTTVTLDSLKQRLVPLCMVGDSETCQAWVTDLWSATARKLSVHGPLPQGSQSYGEWCTKLYSAQQNNAGNKVQVVEQATVRTKTQVESAIAEHTPKMLEQATVRTKPQVESVIAEHTPKMLRGPVAEQQKQDEQATPSNAAPSENAVDYEIENVRLDTALDSLNTAAAAASKILHDERTP